jgi:hypothetical protein
MNKTRMVQVRITPVERQALERMARIEARKVSETVRQIIRESAQRRGCWPMSENKVQESEGRR